MRDNNLGAVCHEPCHNLANAEERQGFESIRSTLTSMKPVEYWLWQFKDADPDRPRLQWFMRPEVARAMFGETVEAIPGTMQMREDEVRPPNTMMTSPPMPP